MSEERLTHRAEVRATLRPSSRSPSPGSAVPSPTSPEAGEVESAKVEPLDVPAFLERENEGKLPPEREMRPTGAVLFERVAAVRRGQEAEAARKLDAGEKPSNNFEKTVMAQVEARRASQARLGDPVEQAKLALQRKGRIVHCASIHGGRRGYFMVGGKCDPRTGRLKELSPSELIALAEKVTGQTFRRAAAAPPHTGQAQNLGPAAPAAEERRVA